MARQRLVKPEFFQHDELHRAELVSALPLRVAYIGLWTQADRRGLFEWRPARLKLNILPFDDVDFGAVLDALESAGFVRSYVVDGKRFGCIPAFGKHQTFHAREEPAKHIPDPPAPPQHGASPVPAPPQPGVSPSVTVTVTGTDAVTGADETPPPPSENQTDAFWSDKRVDAFMRQHSSPTKREAWRAIIDMWRAGGDWAGERPTDQHIASGLTAAITASNDAPLSQRFVAACIRDAMRPQKTATPGESVSSIIARLRAEEAGRGAA